MTDTVSSPWFLSETEREGVIMDYLKEAQLLAREQARKVPPHLGDELQCVARFALAEAACAFDRRKDVEFKTYAERKIKGAMVDFLREQDYLPREDRRTLKRIIKKLNGSLTATNLDEAIDALTSQKKNIEKGRKSLLKGAARRILEFGKDTIHISLDDLLFMLPQTTEASPETFAIENERVQRLRMAISGLPEAHRLVVLGFFENQTIKTISGALDCHESRVYQLKSEAIDILQGALACGPGEPHGYVHSKAFLEKRNQRRKRYHAKAPPSYGPS